jgi:hypothetical protein
MPAPSLIAFAPKPMFKGFVPQSFPYPVPPFTDIPQLTPAETIAVAGALNVKWWYSYLPTTSFEIPGAQFVPNIFDSTYLTAPNLAAAASRGGPILTFNEPDQPAPQANLTPAAVLSVWHQFELARASVPGVRLGAPAVSTAANVNGTGHPWPGAGSSWLWDFMNGTVPETGNPPIVDFIPVHIYPANVNNASACGSAVFTYVVGTFGLYRKPLWVTEYDAIDFAGGAPAVWNYPANSAQAVANLTAMINTGMMPAYYVERSSPYPTVWSAFMPPGASGDVHSVELCDLTGTLRALGTAYAAGWNFG